MKMKYRVLIITECLIFITFLFVFIFIVQNGILTAKNDFISCIEQHFDNKAVVQKLNDLNDPESFLQELYSEIETIPFKKTAVVINTQGIVAAISFPDKYLTDTDTTEEQTIQNYVDAAQKAFVHTDFEKTHWLKSTEKDTDVRFDFYCLINGIPTVLFVEFKLSPLQAVFINDNFLFLSAEIITLFFFIQFAALILFVINKKKEEKLEKSHYYFLNGIAHEIKTPLAEIINLTECASIISTADETEKYIKMISDCSEKLNSIVELTLKNNFYLGDRQLNKRRFLLSEAVNNKVSEYLPLFNKKNIAVNTEYTDSLVISADPQLIDIVIGNFLSNALKYTAADCPVTIRTYKKGNKAGFSIYNRTDLSVDCKSIWNSAYKPDNVTGRIHGVGLALNKKILQLHRFRYGCRMEEGGIQFFFEAKQQSF